MKHQKEIKIFIFILLLTLFIIYPLGIKADSLSASFSLTSLITDIKEERSVEGKKYNAYVIDKHESGCILTDDKENLVYAYLDNKTNATLLNGEMIIFEVESFSFENGIFLITIKNIIVYDTVFFYPENKTIDIDRIYTNTLKRVEVNEILINNGKAITSDFITINVFDGFTNKPYENGIHMHVIGYVLRKNDVELNFYITKKYEGTETLNINTKSLGIKGISYGNGESTINGVTFKYKEIGDYGFDIQMRSKTNSSNNISSTIYNIDEFKKPIKSIKITYNSSKTPRNENHVLAFKLGNTKECKDAIVYLNTNENRKEYEIEIKRDYKYIIILVPDTYGYSNFIESFIIEFKD